MRDRSKEQSGYQMLSFNAGCAHLLLLYSPSPAPAFLVCITVVTYFKQLGQHLLFLLIPYPCMHFWFQ